MQECLQEAIDAVEAHAKTLRLSCSPEKSEQLTYQPTPRGQKTLGRPANPQFNAERGRNSYPRSGQSPSSRPALAGEWEQWQDHTIPGKDNPPNNGRLITWIASKRRGMKEKTLLRLLSAFLISRVTYVASFLPSHKQRCRRSTASSRQHTSKPQEQ